MDVKIGRKSYDPFASSEKIQQQVSKYPLMEEIGFLVLGMRVRVILVTYSSLENYRCHYNNISEDNIFWNWVICNSSMYEQRFLSLSFTDIWSVSAIILYMVCDK